MRRSVVDQIAELARAQDGAVAVRQLDALKVSYEVRQAVIAAGWLLASDPGVLVVAGSPDTWRRRLRSGLLALGDHAWVSHGAAAHLHCLDRSVETLTYSLPRARRTAVGTVEVHTTGVIGPLDVVTVDGFRCTSATRTIIDLAYVKTPTVQLEAAIDSAVRLGKSAPQVVARRLGELRGPGRRGARALDQLLVDSGGETRLERLFLRLVREAGLPRPVTQRVVRHDSRHVARVDFCFEAQRVVVEVTGRVGHSSPADRARDAQRRNELIDVGFRVFEYTWHDVRHREREVLGTLRSRLAHVERSGHIDVDSST